MKINFEASFTPQVHPYPGDYTVIDGPDGSGKSIIIEGFLEEARAQGIIWGDDVLSCDRFEREHYRLPDFHRPVLQNKPNPAYVDLNQYKIVLGSEPCYAMSATREEVTSQFDSQLLHTYPSRSYSALDTLEQYSSNRRVKLGRVVMPALQDHKLVFMSRSISATLWYQTVQARMEGLNFGYDEIFSCAGNRFAAEHLPNRLIVPCGVTASDIMSRLGYRRKRDACKFENLEFQLKVIQQINSEEGRALFDQAGVEMIFVDTGGTPEQTKERARSLFREKILPQYRNG